MCPIGFTLIATVSYELLELPGSEQGLGPYGTYDMAGNVKEWTWNETGNR